MPKSATEAKAFLVSDSRRGPSLWAWSAVLRDYGIYIILVIITLAFSFTTKGFATLNNLILILLQVSVMGIISVGMLFVMHVAIALVTYSALVYLAPVRVLRRPSHRAPQRVGR